MMRVELRCTPSTGPADLAWLADLTSSLHTIHDFLLRAEITEEVERERTLRPDELARAVDGQAAEQGSPIVHVREGSMVIELAARLVDSTVPAQVLASLALLFAKGPEVAAWPGHVRKAWYESRTEAEQARRSYLRITEGSEVTVVGDETGPPPAAQAAPRRGRRGDLPGGVRASPPLKD